VTQCAISIDLGGGVHNAQRRGRILTEHEVRYIRRLEVEDARQVLALVAIDQRYLVAA
jgi:hypothetical protein